jgi:glucuronosyltransferase
MHIKRTTNPLPSDIKKFIDESESVIYFSLGSNLSPRIMAVEKQQAVIKALSKVKRRILWKWDDENIDVDKNKFLIRKWFPQDDILAHKKVNLFVTHGGLLSGSESVYYGKPLLVIPIFGDQKLNAARTVASGYGVRVDYKNLTEGSLTWALNEMLTNPKYTETVKELSKRFTDRPQHPVDLAKFYVEYVIRHKGAPFMQTSSVYLSFIEFYNIDVIIVIALCAVLISFIPIWILRKCYAKPSTDNNQSRQKTKKN